jgi:hypothetical protein
MAIIAKDNQKEYTPAPEGLHLSVCCDVIDQGIQETQWGPKPKVDLRWQTETTYTDETTSKEKRFQVTKRYTLSLSEKSSLRRDLEAWRGRKFTKEELLGFDLEKLIEANCQLQIIHNIADNGKVYGNIQAIVPIGRGMTKIRPLDYIRVINRAHATEPIQPEDDDDSLPF